MKAPLNTKMLTQRQCAMVLPLSPYSSGSGLVEGHRDGKQVRDRISPSIQLALANRQDRPWISAAMSCGFQKQR